MKAVAADTFIGAGSAARRSGGDPAGYDERRCRSRRIAARSGRASPAQRSQRGMRLVRRRQRNKSAPSCNYARHRRRRPGNRAPATDNPITGRDQPICGDRSLKPVQQRRQRILVRVRPPPNPRRSARTPGVATAGIELRSPMPSHPVAEICSFVASAMPANSANLMLEDPAFRTRMASFMD